MIYFTSDQHFDHKNVIQLCNRPFQDVDHMNWELIKRHNTRVRPEDTVIHLGDFSLHHRSLFYLKAMNGMHFLVPGNHDGCHPSRCKSDEKMEKMFKLYQDAGFHVLGLKVHFTLNNKTPIRLCHLPYKGDHTEEERYLKYRPDDSGDWLLHGHVHNLWKVRGKQINVGVDQWDYAPVSLDQIMEIINEPVS